MRMLVIYHPAGGSNLHMLFANHQVAAAEEEACVSVHQVLAGSGKFRTGGLSM